MLKRGEREGKRETESERVGREGEEERGERGRGRGREEGRKGGRDGGREADRHKQRPRTPPISAPNAQNAHGGRIGTTAAAPAPGDEVPRQLVGHQVRAPHRRPRHHRHRPAPGEPRRDGAPVVRDAVGREDGVGHDLLRGSEGGAPAGGSDRARRGAQRLSMSRSLLALFGAISLSSGLPWDWTTRDEARSNC